MKEIWKLIELLIEAQNSWIWLFWHWVGNFERKYYAKNHWRLIIETLGYTDEDYEIYDYSDRDICGKDGGFIKWLVENDKIDIVKVYENLTNYEIEIRIRAVKELLENNEEDTIAYLKLLMLLAIQDEPIRFLCEIIK